VLDKLRNPQLRVKLAIAQLVVCIIGWPVTALTVFKTEPQGILGLSWTALILTAIDILATTDTRQQQEEENA
jgi:hypothetical protein